ncbi:MAG: ATP-binding protein, partial [Pseudomonadota bacterium]
NYVHFPEISQVLAEGRGWNLRPGDAEGHSFLYLAESLGRPGPPLLIFRIAVPMKNLEENLGLVRRLIIWASFLGVLLSFGAAFILAHQIFRPVKELTRTALNISAGDFSQRLRRYPRHDLGDLGRAFDRMADHLQEEIEAVTRARDRLEAILRGMVEGVLVTDDTGRITLANRALGELLGLSASPVGRRPSEIFRNADLIEAIQQVQRDKPYESLEIRTLGRNPRTMEVEVAALPGQGPLAGVVAVFHDITERKRLEEIRRDFVANVSHELRTPLAAIRGAVETLLEGALDDPKVSRKFTQIVERHVRRLEGLVLDLLELARLESGDSGEQRNEIALAGLAENSLAAVADLAAARNITLKKNIPTEPLYIPGDQRQLEQALVNLLDNAVKYTDAGGLVTLSAAKDERMVHLKVSDTGPGIPAEHIPRIFERFYRVDKNRSRELGGTGLGLAIVKHVAQVHGGRVEVDSFPGRGSTFTLILPLRS